MFIYFIAALVLSPLFFIGQKEYLKDREGCKVSLKWLGIMLIAYFGFIAWGDLAHAQKQEAFEPFVVRSLETAIEKINPIDRWVAGAWNVDAKGVGKIFKNIANYTIPCLLLLFVGSIKRRLGLVVLFYVGHNLTDSITRVIKGYVLRYRPFVYRSQEQIDALDQSSRASFNEDLMGYDITNSFFSGDTCAVGYGMVFFGLLFQQYYPASKYKGVVWGLIGVSILLGVYFRTISGKHFATDTLMGALFGGFMAWCVVYVHTKWVNSKYDVVL
jgi:hypothetical protein